MSEINHKERKHSPLGASIAKRWMNCSGSVELSKKAPVEPETEYAREGTCAHELAEYCLVNITDAQDCVGMEFHGVKVTEEMASAVQVYLNYIAEQCESGDDLLMEEKVDLSFIHKDMYGTNDCAIVKPFGQIIVIDYKHGKGIPVDAIGNEQLLYYALGFKSMEYWTTMKLVIVQPRAEHPDGPIREWVVTKEDLDDFEVRIRSAVDAVFSNPDVYNSGDHCHYCPARGFCPTLRKNSYEAVSATFRNESVTSLPKVEELTPEQIKRVLDSKKMIEIFLDGVENYAYNMAQLGAKIDGYKLVQKRSNRTWENESTVIERLSTFGEQIFDKKLKTPAQMEKLVGKEIVKELCYSPDNGTTLVPISDKRPEVTLLITDDLQF